YQGRAITGNRGAHALRPSARFGTIFPAAGSKLGPTFELKAVFRPGFSAGLAFHPPSRPVPAREHRDCLPPLRSRRARAPARQSRDSRRASGFGRIPGAAASSAVTALTSPAARETFAIQKTAAATSTCAADRGGWIQPREKRATQRSRV